jgi:hypothetical protein
VIVLILTEKWHLPPWIIEQTPLKWVRRAVTYYGYSAKIEKLAWKRIMDRARR